MSWEEVRKEIIEEKGVDSSVADKIGQYTLFSGGSELVEKLMKDENLCKSKSSVSGLEGMKLFLKYCHLYGIGDKVVFDLSLARGLDYYTGVIFEAVLLGERFKTRKKFIQRYDR